MKVSNKVLMALKLKILSYLAVMGEKMIDRFKLRNQIFKAGIANFSLYNCNIFLQMEMLGKLVYFV